MPAYLAVTDWLAEELAFARGGATPVSVLIEKSWPLLKAPKGYPSLRRAKGAPQDQALARLAPFFHYHLIQ